jgi:hypothetical protein
MKTLEFIPIDELCVHYEIETTFFKQLKDYGLIEITTVESTHCISTSNINEVEKMIRMHKDLSINLEGIDTIFNLLKKIEGLQDELVKTKNRLSIYEKID